VIIFLNGKRKEVAPGTALLFLLAERGYKPGQVVIELNQAIIARAKYGETVLTENDTVEILEFVGGG
jgi:sulfur carrier protein